MEKSIKYKPIEILLVEDNEGDILLTIEALKTVKIINNLKVIEDGEKAVEYIRGEGEFKGRIIPDLILLDLNLPKIDGREILHIIKNDDKVKFIPVVILTTSKSEEDILKSYLEHANCYITKPIDMVQFIKIVQCIGDFWFDIVKLPEKK
ncbi:MAG: response regulator [Promethearchaeota archaeon]